MSPPTPNSTTLKRIHREIADLKKEDLGAITLGPAGDNLFVWTASIPGPEGSCYEGGLFHVDIHLANDYPFSAPKVTFRTRIYHMNINDRGNICIDILKHNWSPALSLFKVILSLSSLLTDPNPKDPLVASIATEYVRNRKKHDRTAHDWTELYARPKPSTSDASPSQSAKGKEKAVPAASSPSSSNHPSRGAGAGTAQSHTIVIDDFDEAASATTAQRQPQTRAGAKRKRGQVEAGGSPPGAAIVIEDDDEAALRPARRKRGAPARGGGSGEVIVIED